MGSDFEDELALERARRVVEYVGAAGFGVLATLNGRIKLASGDHAVLAVAVETVARTWRDHAVTIAPDPRTVPTSVCVAACVDGVHVLAARVGVDGLLVTVMLQGLPTIEARARLTRAAGLLDRFSPRPPGPEPSGGGSAPSHVAVYVDDANHPRRRAWGK